VETLPQLLSVSVASGRTGPGGPQSDISGPRPLIREPHDLARTRLDEGDLHQRMTTGQGLAELAAPFAAVTADGNGGLIAATDHMGLGLVYGTQGDGWAAIAGSARELAGLSGAGLDRTALGVYRLVGIHLGEATAFEGVQSLAAGHRWHLADGTLTAEAYPPPPAEPGTLTVREGVAKAAALLRRDLTRILDEFPDVVFQLSGGLDTRLLLAAVPPERRRGLRALTLRSTGNADEEVARTLAQRYGMEHGIVDLDDLGTLTPEEIHTLVQTASLANEQVFSPLQLGMIQWAEGRTAELYGADAPRIDGIGGEISRGMYHALQRQHPSVTPELVERLARWRIFSRDSVDADCLDPGFAEESERHALKILQETFATYDMDWLSATDAYWYTIRSHRGTGSVQTQAGRRRAVLMPFAHPEYVAITAALPATAKRGSRFNAQVVKALDPELAAIPMDTGVRPDALTAARPVTLLRTGRDYAHRVSGKVRQRINRRGVSGAVPATLTRGLVAHWRAHPQLLEPVAASGLFSESWLAGLLAGDQEPAPATAAFISIVEAAATPK